MLELHQEIDGSSAWYGPEIVDRAQWMEPLTLLELAEIERASQRLAQTEINCQTLHHHDFPLPVLEQRLSRFLHEILEGRGFVLLRGLPVERWGRRLSAIAFLGIGLHLGNLRSQNRHGHLLGHVRDL